MSVSRRSFAFDLASLCAPTLAGLKPASLFRYQPGAGQSGSAMAAAWHAALCDRGVAVRVLKTCPRTGAVLVYVYRPGTADELLAQLSQRLCCEGDFPHEVGIFLGYPLADVVGFIQNRGQNFTACGHWKVYTDPAAAQQQFARYKKCETIYTRCYQRGTPIRRLTVAA